MAPLINLYIKRDLKGLFFFREVLVLFSTLHGIISKYYGGLKNEEKVSFSRGFDFSVLGLLEGIRQEVNL